MRRAVRAIVRLFRAGSGGRATNAPEIPEAKAVYDHCQLAPPPGAESDHILYFQASARMLTGEPLPPGWSVVQRIRAVPTGRVDEAGNREFVVRLYVGERRAVRKAWLLLDGRVVFRATRWNGAIVEASTGPVATLTVLVSPAPPWEVTLRWRDAARRNHEESLAQREPGKFSGRTSTIVRRTRGS
ncbi:MAG TPA: hypothetical protein VFI25_10800 [Planctomycetota bacterium]|jgi:hypothetical protein|nr:hypothetical protein [Planctomycetota bacterium]